MVHSAEDLVALLMDARPGVDGPSDGSAALTAPPDLWLEAARRFPMARFALAHHKRVPAPVLELLAGDPDPRVRTMVAMKRKAPAALLRALAADENSGVRLSVAFNRSTPAEVLALLADDAWDEVRARARTRLAELAERHSSSR